MDVDTEVLMRKMYEAVNGPVPKDHNLEYFDQFTDPSLDEDQDPYLTLWDTKDEYVHHQTRSEILFNYIAIQQLSVL